MNDTRNNQRSRQPTCKSERRDAPKTNTLLSQAIAYLSTVFQKCKVQANKMVVEELAQSNQQEVNDLVGLQVAIRVQEELRHQMLHTIPTNLFFGF